MESKRKIIVILGPTASGKSALAVKIAKKFNGEIISADSRQVYKRLDIGTGKITKKEMGGIPHHCISIVSPKKIFTVVDFKKCADKAIEEIFAKNKTPIIVGGTGLYIQAVVDNIVLPEVKPNWKLRKELEKKTTEEMFAMLKKLDPKRAKNIDAKNPRRLIRAIEIAKTLGKIPNLAVKPPSWEFLQIGVRLPNEILKKNIEKRIKKMLKDGLVAETKKLRNPPNGGGLSWKRIYELGFEYKYPALFLQKKISKDEMLSKMLIENWQYAKRQMTWFSAHGGSASGGKRDKKNNLDFKRKTSGKIYKRILNKNTLTIPLI